MDLLIYMDIRKLFSTEDSKRFQTELSLIERTGVPESSYPTHSLKTLILPAKLMKKQMSFYYNKSLLSNLQSIRLYTVS